MSSDIHVEALQAANDLQWILQTYFHSKHSVKYVAPKSNQILFMILLGVLSSTKKKSLTFEMYCLRSNAVSVKRYRF